MTEPNPADVLAPCPFCGTNDRLRVYEPFDPSDETSVVTCDNCNAEGPYHGGTDSTSEAEAIELWSRRDRLDALITKAEKSLPALRQQAQPTPDAMAALENPTLEMCRAAIVAWDNNAVESDEAGMKAALTAAAAHLKGQTNDRT